MRVLARREHARVGNVLKMFAADWRRDIDWGALTGAGPGASSLMVSVRARVADPETGRSKWYSTMVEAPLFKRPADLIRFVHEKVSIEAKERGSPIGELGDVRKDRLHNLSIEAIEPL
ncbi:MAG: hypothetical protein ACRD1X_01595 [Vicinamibacteria bacterium]